MAAKKTFEQSIAELEDIVAKLEGGNVSLEESIALFENGIKLTKSCKDLLDKAERIVSVLMADASGEIVKEPFPDMEN